VGLSGLKDGKTHETRRRAASSGRGAVIMIWTRTCQLGLKNQDEVSENLQMPTRGE